MTLYTHTLCGQGTSFVGFAHVLSLLTATLPASRIVKNVKPIVQKLNPPTRILWYSVMVRFFKQFCKNNTPCALDNAYKALVCPVLQALPFFVPPPQMTLSCRVPFGCQSTFGRIRREMRRFLLNYVPYHVAEILVGAIRFVRVCGRSIFSCLFSCKRALRSRSICHCSRLRKYNLSIEKFGHFCARLSDFCSAPSLLASFDLTVAQFLSVVGCSNKTEIISSTPKDNLSSIAHRLLFWTRHINKLAEFTACLQSTLTSITNNLPEPIRTTTTAVWKVKNMLSALGLTSCPIDKNSSSFFVICTSAYKLHVQSFVNDNAYQPTLNLPISHSPPQMVQRYYQSINRRTPMYTPKNSLHTLYLLPKEKCLDSRPNMSLTLHKYPTLQLCSPSKLYVPNSASSVLHIKWRPVVSQKRFCFRACWKKRLKPVLEAILREISKRSQYPEALEMSQVVEWMKQACPKQPSSAELQPLELDLDNAFSNIPQQEIFQALHDFHSIYLDSHPYVLVTSGGFLNKYRPGMKRDPNAFAWADFEEALRFEVFHNCRIQAGGTCVLQTKGIPMGSWIASFIQQFYCAFRENHHALPSFQSFGWFLHPKEKVITNISTQLYYDFLFTRYKDNLYFLTHPSCFTDLQQIYHKIYSIPVKVEGMAQHFHPLNLHVNCRHGKFCGIHIMKWPVYRWGNLVSLNVHTTHSHTLHSDTDREKLHAITQGHIHRCIQYSLNMGDIYINLCNMSQSFIACGLPVSCLLSEFKFFLLKVLPFDNTLGLRVTVVSVIQSLL